MNTWIILILFGFVALAFLQESRKKARKTSSPDSTELLKKPVSADEAQPTETGLFRVREVFKQAPISLNETPSPKKAPVEKTEPDFMEEEALPDPFAEDPPPSDGGNKP